MIILFLTDIFKHPVDYLPTNHDWLADLWFSNIKYKVTKINEILKPNDASIGIELPVEPYTSVLKKSSITKISDYLKKTVSSFDYIIAFECCHETREILEKLHPKIIYIYFSPLRYSNRQTFTLSSNNNQIQQKIINVSNLGISYYQQQANYVKHLVNNKQPNVNLKPKSILLIGQVEADLSVWNGKKYTNLDDYYDEIMKLASDYDTIYYKPHPFSKKNNDRIVNATNIINTDIEIYRLLSSDAIEHVVTVSSSVAKEAKFFNKKVTQFSSLYISDSCQNIPYTMDDNFWNYLLETTNENLIKKLVIDSIDIRPIRNTYWGYKCILELESTMHNLQELNTKFEKKQTELLVSYNQLHKKNMILEEQYKALATPKKNIFKILFRKFFK
ncbi:hypothetical protein [Wenyingzhuangia aestuarii]|uniref:hypothetical protein n=1 Tax=Wenyingzhuangia aestuarii TaxID=1647582 RepID=UPI00143BF251|nr:hypothetical protein [Wenyingzhuangia aestuarii]NJB82891.1 hypothetical protein [Wenyingzhuangia aestuarii]